jgi:cyclase
MTSSSQAFADLLRAIHGCEIVDLSTDIARHADGPFKTRVEVLEPKPGAQFFIERVLPKVMPEAVDRLRPEDFPAGAFLRHEMVTASVHAGSHIDAPGHYGPGVSGIEASFINGAPLEPFMAPGIFYDASAVPGNIVRKEDIDRIRREGAIGDVTGKIVLIRTGGNKALAPDVVESLLDAGVSVIGMDNESFDGDFRPMIERFLASSDPSALWPCHMLGRRRPYYQIERLGALERLPSSGFLVIAFPVRIAGATAAWTRAVALVPRAAPASEVT